MPKEKADIPNFGSGLFLSHRDPEVPDNAITEDSLNVDITKDGYIRMARASKAVPADPAFTEMIKWLWRFKLEAQSKLLIYGTGADKGFHLYDDDPSSATTVEGEKISGSDEHEVDQTKIAASASNLALHLGVGSELQYPPLWIGKYPEIQFGELLPSAEQGYQITRAELFPLDQGDDFPAMHKVVKSGDAYFGIALNGEAVFQFNDSELVNRTSGSLGVLTAICNDPASNDFIWVYEQGAHSLLRINVTSMTVSATLSIQNNQMFVTGTQLTDIEISDNLIFMALTNPETHKADSEKFIYSVPYSATSGNVNTTSFAFVINAWDPSETTIEPGNEPFAGESRMHWWPIKEWIDDNTSPSVAESRWDLRENATSENLDCTLKIPPVCLTQVSPNGIGLIALPVFTGDYSIVWDGAPQEMIIEDAPGFWVVGVNGGNSIYGTTILAILSSDMSFRSGAAGTQLFRSHTVVLDPVNWDDEGFPDSAITFNAIGDTMNPVHSIQELGTDVLIGHNKMFGLAGTQNTKIPKAELTPDSSDHVYPQGNSELFFVIIHDELAKLRHIIEANDDVFMWAGTGDSPIYLKGSYDEAGSNVTDIQTLEKSLLTETEVIPGTGFVNENDMDRVFYRTSLIYDGIGESPLSQRVTVQVSDNDGVRLKIFLDKNMLSRRCTHLNIYRTHGLLSAAELGFYRLVESIDLSEPWPLEDGYHVITYDDLNSTALLGPSFEASSGLPETLRNTMPHYGLSVMLNDRLYIADCWHPEIEKAELFLFRSNRFSVDSFNWPENVLRLPATPVALAQMNGRIFVFDRSDCHIVNPESMYVEQTIQGAGAINRNSVVMTPDGIFVAGHYHAYQFTGSGRNIISRPVEIRDKDGIPWSQLANGNNFHALYHEQKREIIFLSSRGTPHNDARALSFNIPDQYWKAFRWATTNITAAGSTYHGEVVVADQDVMKWLFAGTDGLVANTVIRTKTFDFQDGNNNKWIYGLKIEATTENFNVTMQNQNSSHSFYMTKENLGDGFFYLPIPANERKVRTIRFFIDFDEDVKIHKVSIAYRRKVIYAGEDV